MEDKKDGLTPTMEQERAFVNAAVKACKSRRQGAFTCPICEGTATAMKSSYNGHIMAVCSNCGLSFRQ